MSRSDWPAPPARRWTAARRIRERTWLEALHARYHDPALIEPDPLQLVRPFAAAADREVAGVIAAALAYGNVTAMLPAIRRVLDLLGPQPAAGLDAAPPHALQRELHEFRYRVTTGDQLAGLLVAVRGLRRSHGSLEDVVLQGLGDAGPASVVAGLSHLAAELGRASPVPLAHLWPDPAAGSACKRPALWLRWMVRRDGVDPGGWDRLPPAGLLMPVDTHVFQTARTRRWTRRRTANLATAMELTARLHDLEPGDPLRWDFAITRPGIRGTPA